MNSKNAPKAYQSNGPIENRDLAKENAPNI
jgi:hypothetical protein